MENLNYLHTGMIPCISNRLFITFPFWNHHRYISSCKKSTGRSPCTLHLVPLIVMLQCDYIVIPSSIHALQPQTHGGACKLDRVNLFFIMPARENIHHREPQDISVFMNTVEKIPAIGFGLWWGCFGGKPKEVRFTLAWLLWECGAILWWGTSTRVFRERRQARR